MRAQRSGGTYRKGEEVFLDRPNRNPGDRAEVFNRRLEAYLQAHPEVAAPAPERSSYQSKPGKAYDFKNPVPRF